LLDENFSRFYSCCGLTSGAEEPDVAWPSPTANKQEKEFISCHDSKRIAIDTNL
jgi:hypothetical protein